MIHPVQLIWFFVIMTDPLSASLVEKLGSDSWKDREAASAALSKMDEKPIFFLRLAESTSGEPEVRRRANRLVNRFENSLVPTTYGKMPWIDHLPKDFPDRSNVMRQYLGSYKNDHGYDGTGEYVPFRMATADFIKEYSRKGRSRDDCVKLLDNMVKSEQKWLTEQKIVNGGRRTYFHKPWPFGE